MVAHDIPENWEGSCDRADGADCYFFTDNFDRAKKGAVWADGKERVIRSEDIVEVDDEGNDVVDDKGKQVTSLCYTSLSDHTLEHTR